MMHFNSSSISKMDKIQRLNLINSCTGYKSANLIGTKSTNGITNLAVFSSITHLGSNPALLGFVLRPTTVPRNTYTNIKETNYFTVNHIHKEITKQAHQTSAKYDADISEFSKVGLTESFIHKFWAPYVHESKIKIGCKYQNEYHIKENDTILVVGSIEHIYVEEGIMYRDGWLNLSNARSVAINGLDAYAVPDLLNRYTYARPEKPTTSVLLGNA